MIKLILYRIIWIEETIMNPETRTLTRVTIEDLASAKRRVNVLMGDKVEPRRKWIEDNVKF